MLFIGIHLAVEKNHCLTIQQAVEKYLSFFCLFVLFLHFMTSDITDRKKVRNQYILLPKEKCQKVAQVSVYNDIFSKIILKYMTFHVIWLFQQLHFMKLIPSKLSHFLESCLPKCDCTTKEYVSMKTEELSIPFTHKSIYYH